MQEYKVQDWLPTSRKEMELRGWDEVDVIFFSGDAYVDHPSFGAAVIGRVLEAEGYRVAIVPQPNWRDDLRDFRKLGRPRLFFALSAGAMDSMVNHYTANKRLRSDDAYTPDGRYGMRPDYPTIVYSRILKELFPDVPVVVGGIEASLRRVTHYDYWQDKLRPSIMTECHADIMVYGMGERSIREIAHRLDSGETINTLRDVPQTVVLEPADMMPTENNEHAILASHEECLRDKRVQAANFKIVEEESNAYRARHLWQRCGNEAVHINPPYPPMTTEEVDATFDLPYTRLPHPRYKGKTIPAYEMIRHSVCLHRGCFGGCAFCTISAHQGKFISSRSEDSIMREVEAITHMPDFKGYISDLGGPSANMYTMRGEKQEVCQRCRRPSCLFPAVCPNLVTDHRPLLDLFKKVDAIPDIKKSHVGSGVRYDLVLHRHRNPEIADSGRLYAEELIARHVSGRLKVAPEHTSDKVLHYMRKPSFGLFHAFKTLFDKVNKREGLRQQLIPYFISSHPGCTEEAMAELAVTTKYLNFHLEQVQDFTPTPMTLATEMYYTGIDPYTGEKVFTARTPEQKLGQRKYFFWYQRESEEEIRNSLNRMHRADLIRQLYGDRPFIPLRTRHEQENKNGGNYKGNNMKPGGKRPNAPYKKKK
ncbi:MAG: YgiQ family radical SAM protein [Bacteroidaceae bacterium]|nr:YgiQ family radical SAM protein [Bacteroidaceae bacterium]